MDRAKRKRDHIDHALTTGQMGLHGFGDLTFIHRSFPGIATTDIDLSSKIGELTLSSPIFINAMTGGGGLETLNINEGLAHAAKHCKLAVSVGSQTAALKDPAQKETFTIVRKTFPNGLIFGNVGSDVTVDEAKRAVDMLEANALQVHLNTVQELVMPEGDRDFSQILTNIERMNRELNVPIIVKEVGFGMSKETVSQLMNIGIEQIDIGGYGGTNFAKIENKRRQGQLPFFDDWGIPTVVSLAEAAEVKHEKVSVIASGGLQNASHIAKSIALGASATALAGFLLEIQVNQGTQALIDEIEKLHEHLRVIMTALGTRTIADLQKAPLLIKGDSYHWLQQRGIDTKKYSLRSFPV